jgi:hypothetical protein
MVTDQDGRADDFRHDGLFDHKLFGTKPRDPDLYKHAFAEIELLVAGLPTGSQSFADLLGAASS